MSYSYDTKKKAADRANTQEPAAPAQETDALRAGMMHSAGAQSAHRVDLPDAMRAKMENAFGADLSAVKLYESQAVADAGAEAVTQGSNIAFAPGKLDFASSGGQSLLGHELSHVVSQARGEVTGSGFLNDHALEARADREGAMAAAGQQVYAGPVTGAMSAAAPAASAAAPMQAKRGKDSDTRVIQAEDAKTDYKVRTAPKQLDYLGETRHWGDVKWSHGKRRKHNKKLTATTGLSQKKEDIQARMDADMAWNNADVEDLEDDD